MLLDENIITTSVTTTVATTTVINDDNDIDSDDDNIIKQVLSRLHPQLTLNQATLLSFTLQEYSLLMKEIFQHVEQQLLALDNKLQLLLQQSSLTSSSSSSNGDLLSIVSQLALSLSSSSLQSLQLLLPSLSLAKKLSNIVHHYVHAVEHSKIAIMMVVM